MVTKDGEGRPNTGPLWELDFAATAREHAVADAACGRDWLDGGCACAACRVVRDRVRAEGRRAP